MTVLEAIKRSTEFLEKKGVESPRLQTELLLAHLLNLRRMQLYLNFERALQTGEVDAFRELIRRRGQREPLQHIVGSTSFCGFEMLVNRNVLIPRPETELLAEQGWTFLNRRLPIEDRERGASSLERESVPAINARARDGSAPIALATMVQGRSTLHSPCSSSPLSALDFGTGTGCLAILLALKCTGTEVYALERSAEALAVARQNAERHAMAERIRFLQADGLGALPKDATFDLVISNPPYIPTAEIETLQPEVRDHEPRGALDGGLDGLDYFRRLAKEIPAGLKPDGRLMLEVGDGQAEAVRGILQTEMWIVEAVQEDYNQHSRIIIARRTD